MKRRVVGVKRVNVCLLRLDVLDQQAKGMSMSRSEYIDWMVEKREAVLEKKRLVTGGSDVEN